MQMSNFKIENDDLTINEFMSVYEYDADPIDEIIKVVVLVYIRKNLGEMRPNEIVDSLSQYGDGFAHHVTEFFNINDW